MILKKTAEREKQEKDLRLKEKFKVCESLPEDWTLKTELDIQMPLLKSVEDVSEILNFKDVARNLSYYIYMETPLPKFLQESQNAEYIRNSDKISWVKSFKDVYQKFCASYQHLNANPANRHSTIPDSTLDDLDMPCFYLRNQASIALFKIDSANGGTPVAELIPSLNLAKVIKEK